MNKKYILLNESLKAISEGNLNVLILVGEAGMSKTFNTLNFLNDNSIKHFYVNSYSTPLSFYELLYKNSDKEVIVFDDVSSIGNPLIVSLLKSCCWNSNKKKIVSYYSTSKVLAERGLPESFEFNANVILIFNEEIKGYASVINRGLKISLNFNFLDKLKIFEEVKEKANIDEEVLDYIKENCNEATQNLSVRTLVILSQLKEKGYDFRLFAEEMLVKKEEIELLRDLNYKDWSKETGKSMKTYYRLRKKYGLN